jgi:hypothetical protein
LTLTLLPVTVPTPLSMLTLVAFDTDQLSVVDPPAVIVDAAALKLPLAMEGAVVCPLLPLPELLPPPPQPDIVVSAKAISSTAIAR